MSVCHFNAHAPHTIPFGCIEPSEARVRFAFYLIAAMALGAVWFARPGLAADYLVTSGTTEISPVTLSDDGDSLTVEKSGAISVAAGDAAVAAAAHDFTIANAGAIEYFDFANGAVWVKSSDGLIWNESTGTISSTLSGIHVEDSTLSLLNDGSIRADDAGIFLSGTDATVINTGTIDALADGIFAFSSNLTIANSGSIFGSSGLNVSSSTVDFYNSGEIAALGYGIRSYYSTVSSFLNTGSISGDEEGIHQHGSQLVGSNSGTISGLETGFSVHDSSTLDFENSGIIKGESFYGMHVYDDIASETTVARITNSGAIIGAEVGVLVQDSQLTLVNTGTVIGGVSGIQQTGTDHLDLINAGIISGSSYSLLLEGTGNSVTLLAGSVLEGDIHLGSADNSFIFGNGLNSLLVFDDTGTLPGSIDTSGMPYVIDSANNQIAVVDPTGFAMADVMLDDLASSVLDSLSRRVPTPGEGGELSAAIGLGETVIAAGDRLNKLGASLWADSFGRWREQGDNGTAWSADHRLGGLVTGIDGILSDRLRGGVFLGAARSALAVDDDAQDIDTTSVYGGFHVSRARQSRFASAVFLAGWQEHDSARHIANNSVAGGLETAKASYNSLFLVPEIAVGTQMGALVSSLAARYTGLFIDGYSEEGSSADLTVAAREVHSFAARVQLALPEYISFAGTASVFLEPRVGLSARFGVGGEGVAAEVLGIGIPNFDPDDDDPVLSLFSGAAAVAQSANGRMRLKFSADLSLGTDQSVTLAAALGGEIAF
jgi:hypothetical protein